MIVVNTPVLKVDEVWVVSKVVSKVKSVSEVEEVVIEVSEVVTDVNEVGSKDVVVEQPVYEVAEGPRSVVLGVTRTVAV